MATSGSFNTSDYEGRYLIFSWSETSKSITGNTTTISWTLKGAGGTSTYRSCQNITVKIDGEVVFEHLKATDGSIKLYDGTVVASGNYTFTHDDDGSRTFEAYAEAGIYVWAVNCTGSSTFTLDPIERESKLSADNGTLGISQEITVTRYNTSFTHTITYTCGNTSGTIVDKSSSTSISWIPPLSLASQNTTGTSVSVTLKIQTYSDSTVIGNASSKTVTMTIPASVKPSCTVSVSDATGYEAKYGSYIKGLSCLQVTITPTATYGASIVSYKAVANGSTYTSDSFTTGVLLTSGTSTVTATVTDARARTSDQASASITGILEYTAPAISSLTVHRCRSNGTLDDQGEYAMVTFSATVTSLNDKNGAEYILHYKKTTDADYTGVALDDLYGTYSVSNYSYIFPADEASSYDVKIAVEDDLYGTTRSTTVSTSFTLLHFNSNGTGIGIGKISERSNAVEFGVPMYDDYGQFESAVSGSSGIWTYKKWLNGDVELWGSYSISNMACTTALGNWYRTAVFTPSAYPFPVYYGYVIANYESDGYGAMLWATTTATDTKPPSYYLIRPTSATIASGKIVFHIKGKWTT